MTKPTIGFIGAGNMANSLLGGMISRGIGLDRIWMSDVDRELLDERSRQYAVHTTTNNEEVARWADVLILAVKPQLMQQVCEPLQQALADHESLIISVAAGVPVEHLRTWLGGPPLVRCMPNTPSLVQAGTLGLYAGSDVSADQQAITEEILGGAGLVLWFEEEKELDAVTAVSGSGPAYFFLMMEAMIEAARAQGLSARQARQLVLQTARGASELALTSEDHPDELRRKVTSPGGTTAAGLEVLEDGGYRELMDRAVEAARRRAEELSQ
jgi:pyrroline-5-carboxylate reductase